MEVYFSTGFNAEVRQAEAVFSLLLLLTASPCSEKAFSSPSAAAPPPSPPPPVCPHFHHSSSLWSYFSHLSVSACLFLLPAGEERRASCPAWRICCSTPSQRAKKKSLHTNLPQWVITAVICLRVGYLWCWNLLLNRNITRNKLHKRKWPQIAHRNGDRVTEQISLIIKLH